MSILVTWNVRNFKATQDGIVELSMRKRGAGIAISLLHGFSPDLKLEM